MYLNKIVLIIVLTGIAFTVFAGHFTAAFNGNGQNQMNINVITATIGGMALEAGDEIAAFDGTICCGIFILTQSIVYSSPSTFVRIAASLADAGLSNGFTSGHAITYKFWDSGNNLEFSGLTAEYIDPITALTTVAPGYTASATVFVKLTVAAPVYYLQATVFMEGPYNLGTGLMNALLKTSSLIPLTQPYSGAPRNYPGIEHVASVPAGVIDWVLVELRTAATPSAATTIMSGWPKACFLKSTGAIVDLDGASLLTLGYPAVSGSLYLVIRHRNHIAIMSSVGMTLTGNNYVYNFTTSVAQAYGGSAGYKLLANGVYGMVSGDSDGDGSVSVLDFSKWATDFGKNQVYIPADIDCDGQVTVLDFSKWATSFGTGNLVPLKRLGISDPDSHSNVLYKCQVP